MAADEHGRPRALDGARMDRVTRHAIVPARERDGLTFEEALDDDNRLAQPLDAGGAGVEGESRLLVLGAHVPGAETELEPTVGEHVERRRLARQQRGMAEVVVEHRGADTQARRRRRGGGQRGERREQVGEVVRDEQHGVAEGFDLPRLVRPFGLRGRRSHVDAEPEWPHERLRASAVAARRELARVDGLFQELLGVVLPELAHPRVRMDDGVL